MEGPGLEQHQLGLGTEPRAQCPVTPRALAGGSSGLQPRWALRAGLGMLALTGQGWGGLLWGGH